jgi:hypothetical protein
MMKGIVINVTYKDAVPICFKIINTIMCLSSHSYFQILDISGRSS